MASSTTVRVGVRVRPLTDQEIGHGGKSVLNASHPEIRLGDRRFTYDEVFEENLSQEDLYGSVSGPLLSSFLNGYNATIMAYGQTGSGKTFTMGSEAHDELDIADSSGLIPRFMDNIFTSLEHKKMVSDKDTENTNSLMDYKLQGSFLEVYGEDVHDLLDPKRKSLPLREDSNGGIVCNGLTQRAVQSAEQSLQVLHEGTHNRTTAATLMNLTSSRSHAVFTITLQQEFSGSGVITSRFTFVDLAGSERMKKTGAQGERAREGIQINKGLLALGNVINALASEDKPHVPYRQSKLTRLLQDALGGNSQTLFLACVSPSDTNASETLSTLHYANRARNIQNAPVQNVDATTVELLRLKSLTQVLQMELVREKFGVAGSEEAVMKRSDVKAYLHEIENLAREKQGSISVPSTLVASSASTFHLTSPRPMKRAKVLNTGMQMASPSPANVDNDKSILELFDPSELDVVNPDEELAILDQLLELQQRDQEFGKEQKRDAAELEQVEGELAEQEVMLIQLRESLKVYHEIKEKYEILMAEVGRLENEKLDLASQLEKASNDPSQGCSKAIQRKLEKVEQALVRARDETQKHRRKVRNAEQEAKKTRVLERKIAELKLGRANLVRKQKQAAKSHREYTECRTREISSLRRQKGAAEQKVSKLQNSVAAHKRHLEKRQAYINKLTTKLKQTEAHLMKLLSMRSRKMRHQRRTALGIDTVKPADTDASDQQVQSLLFLVEKSISGQVERLETEKNYESRVGEYGHAMRELVANMQALEEARSKLKTDDTLQNVEAVEDLEQVASATELRTELLGSEVEDLRKELEEGSQATDGATTLLVDKSATFLRTLLETICGKHVTAQFERNQLEAEVRRKDSAVRTLEREAEGLKESLESLRREIDLRENWESDGVNKINGLEADNKSLSAKAMMYKKENEMLTNRLEALTMKLQDTKSDYLLCRERLALLEVSLAQADGVQAPQHVMEKIQDIWQELGTSSDERHSVNSDITNCLEDTCNRKLDEAKSLQERTEHEIGEVVTEIENMTRALGIASQTRTPPGKGLLLYLESLNIEKARILPAFQDARSRRNELTKQAVDLLDSLEEDTAELPDPLRDLLRDRDHTVTLFHHETLTDGFLQTCEKEIQSMRLRKSERLASNSQVQRSCLSLATRLDLTPEDVLELVRSKTESENSVLSFDLSNSCLRTAVSCATSTGGVLYASSTFTKHLVFIHGVLKGLASGREDVALKLREVVERAQKTLLRTVGSEVDAVDAYGDFHDTLVQLPTLSADYILACVSEVKTLGPGVDAMIQSEQEALSVVWEALGISAAERGRFWEEVNNNTPAAMVETRKPLFKLDGNAAQPEQWLLEAASDVSVSFTKLEVGLYKLHRIHCEVEKMSHRQDAKSRIISLDSEIRILSARLAEFEDKKCNKQRLLSKKVGSSNLLREERFRKQMQGKFTTKLGQLESQLKNWKSVEGYEFDISLLSDEVRTLLEKDGKNKNWVEKRTAFMHLRTVQTNTSAKKSRATSTIDTEVAAQMKEPSQAQKMSTRASRSKIKVDDDNTGKEAVLERKRKPSENSVPNCARSTKSRRTTRATTAATASRILSPLGNSNEIAHLDKEKASNKRLTLPPFAHVLESARTPRRGET